MRTRGPLSCRENVRNFVRMTLTNGFGGEEESTGLGAIDAVGVAICKTAHGDFGGE